MTCPICKRPSAPNSIGGDQRCGPCYNFGIEKFDGDRITVRFAFSEWLESTTGAINDVNNMDTYRPWLEALKAQVGK